MFDQNIWEEEFRILSFHMDPRSEAHLTAICNFLQEGAGAHAESAGFGFNDMIQRNQVWVLSRIKIEIEKYPIWQEYVKLKTWSRGKEGIFYVRDFSIENSKGQSIVEATSSWAAINVNSRRPELVDGLEDGLHSLKSKKSLDEKLVKLPELTNPKFLRRRRIEYTDIDLVYHVNNVEYIEIIVNSFHGEILLKQKIHTIEINYLGEAKYGEDVSVYSDKSKDGFSMVSVIRESDKKEVCRAKINWIVL